MKKLLMIIIILLLSPIVVLAQDSNTELSFNVMANVKFIDQSTEINIKTNGGEKLTEPSHQGKTGYMFLGWFNNDERWDFDNDVVTSHLTLTAKYKEENNIIVDVTDSNDSILNPSISFDNEDITISDSDKEYLANDYVLNIWVEVKDITDEISNEEKGKIDNLADKNNLDVDYYLDIDLYKQIDGVDDTIEQVHNTNKKIKVSLVIPEDMRYENAKYHVIRLHNGKVEDIYSGYPDKNLELVFETDKFSSYAIAHTFSYLGSTDIPPTGDYIVVYVLLLIISLIGLISLTFLSKEKYK